MEFMKLFKSRNNDYLVLESPLTINAEHCNCKGVNGMATKS